jgi:hypothetical protein
MRVSGLMRSCRWEEAGEGEGVVGREAQGLISGVGLDCC